MKYNEKYDLYIDDDLVIYYWDKKLDKLMQRTIYKNNKGYLKVDTKIGLKLVHRIIYETFIGSIPEGMEIDHEDTHKDNNSLDNLILVTHKQNCNNPKTRKHISEAMKGKTNAKGHNNTNTRGNLYSEFGRKFKEHYGITKYQNSKLYDKEHMWYHRHNNKCRWEV